jgi:peptidoglycan LD-endopeptidase LytH
VNGADLAHETAPSKDRAPRVRGALYIVLLLGLVAVVASLALPRSPEPAGPSEVTFPLPQRYEGSFANDWGEARIQGKHEGTDIFAPEGTQIYAITDGTAVRARGSKENGWNSLGGYTVMVEAAYDAGPIRRGDLLYYAHMKSPAGLKLGESVEAGQKIGEVGSTGQGPEGTRGRFEPHLHLGWYEGGWFRNGRSMAASGAMNPYPLLRRIGEDARALHLDS